jgi:hypothetical protein
VNANRAVHHHGAHLAARGGSPAPAPPPPPPPPPPPLTGHAAAAMAKINGLLDEARAHQRAALEPIQLEPRTPPPAPPGLSPVERKANALARQRRELAEQRRKEEAAMLVQRDAYEAIDNERAAQRAAQRAETKLRRPGSAHHVSIFRRALQAA